MNTKIKTIGILIGAFISVNMNLNAQNTLTTQQFNALSKTAQEKFNAKNYSDAYNDYSLLIKNYQSIAPDKYNHANQIDELNDLYWQRAMCAYYLMNNDVDVLFNEYMTAPFST